MKNSANMISAHVECNLILHRPEGKGKEQGGPECERITCECTPNIRTGTTSTISRRIVADHRQKYISLIRLKARHLEENKIE